jgi:hypothetical protein
LPVVIFIHPLTVPVASRAAASAGEQHQAV